MPRRDENAGLKTLYVIRHGQTRWNLERRMQGRLDSPLTDAGGEQAHTHGELLKAMADVGTLYVSPSGRTRETAYIINSYTRSEVVYTDELQERDLGEWSGLTMDEIAKEFPHAYRSRLDDPYNFSPPGGENLVAMGNRVGPFLDGLLAADFEQIGLVTQESAVFPITLAENIAYGTRNGSRESVETAACRAHADEFIRAKPLGYDTVAGERGSTLSGGQRQRIAIARAILRDAPVLIFDEATSQVDTESEQRIQSAVKEFSKGRTTFIIAHRLSTIMFADRIILLENGRVVDTGTHDELLKRCTLYHALCETQLVS